MIFWIPVLMLLFFFGLVSFSVRGLVLALGALVTLAVLCLGWLMFVGV